MRLLLQILSLVLLLACVFPQAQAQDKPEYITTEGYYLGSETGDYNYALFSVNGQETSFFCPNMITDVLNCLQPKELMFIQYSVQEQHLPEAGGIVEMEIIKAVFVPDPYAPNSGIRITDVMIE